MDLQVMTLISTIIMPIISNFIQELFRMISRCKRSKCCNNEVEFNEPIKPESDLAGKKV